MNRKLTSFAPLSFFVRMGLLLLMSGCAPKVYLIDRNTVMEQDAAGDWPAFERELLKKMRATRPVPLPQPTSPSETNRTLNVLNGEMVTKKGP